MSRWRMIMLAFVTIGSLFAAERIGFSRGRAENTERQRFIDMDRRSAESTEKLIATLDRFLLGNPHWHYRGGR